jgi:DNA polymerase-3 subunit alpha
VYAAKKYNMSSVALTDHGVLYGIPEFVRKADKEGIKPIIGMEAYIVKEGSRKDRGKPEEQIGKKKKKLYYHLILLAKNKIGYKNLVKLSTIGFKEGFYYRPRIDLEVLRQFKEGLICSTGCVGGIVAENLVNEEYLKAKQLATTFHEIFGEDFYLEVQDHQMESERLMLEGMPRLSRELGIKIVATNDCHYINKEDAIPHNILLHLSDKTGEVDYKSLRYGTDQIYFKSQEEMIKLFNHLPTAIENTIEIGSKIDFKLSQEEYYFPIFPVPENESSKSLDEYFEFLALTRLKEKFPQLNEEIVTRFNYEIETIKKMGFAGYFLIVQDFINAAKERNIPVGPGRGSAAGSLVAYVLGITNINPLQYDLLFERFLNPERKSMPDIDVDFDDEKRGEVIDYVKQKYGSECVSQIITFNRLSSKAVIRGVARVLKIPIPTVNRITKYIPSKFGKVYTIDQALAEVPELKWVKDSNEIEIQELIKYAKVLEGMNSNAGKHAAGIVITPSDVSDYVPLANATGQEEVVTQFNMKELENAGLLKMDFLGLRTLSIIRDTLRFIKQNHSVQIDIDNIPLDDDKAYKLFWKGQTTGIFQFESAPMREYLKKLKPTSIKDLSAMNALYRPGPMDFINDFIDRKQGKKKVEYLNPILEPILKETYGIIVYQEQVIQIANTVASMSLAEADLLRRAMGKKDITAMKQQRVKFVEGAVKNNIPEKNANDIFEAIDKFANYGFNKSHSVAYSFLAYQTAYLKAHYTAEFLAANLTHEFGDQNKVAKFLEDCRKLKTTILPPDINHPSVYFNVEKGKIRFGLSAIKNVGVPAVESIIKSKDKLGRDFKGIFDFCSNTDNRTVNKRVLEGLILGGAFDSITKNRTALFASVEDALNYGASVQTFKRKHKHSLFGNEQDDDIENEPSIKDVSEWSESEKLKREREVIGYYVTGHPLKKYELEHKSFSTIRLGEVEELENIESVRACGVITDLDFKIDKSGRTMAFFKLDDFTGSCECLMFASAFEKYGKLVESEKPVLVISKPESSGDAIKLQVEEVIPIESAKDRFTKYFKISIEKSSSNSKTIEQLKLFLEKQKGDIPVIVELLNNGSSSRIFSLKTIRVKLTQTLIKDISKLLGEDSILLIPK